jgi:hypothetical protein
VSARTGAAIVEDGLHLHLQIDRRHLLALAQVGDRRVAVLGGHPEGDAAARAALVEAEHEARALGRAPVDVREDAQGPVKARHRREPALGERKSRPPHERAVSENPEIVIHRRAIPETPVKTPPCRGLRLAGT